MTKVYLGLASNAPDAAQMMATAIAHLGIRFPLRVSCAYRSAAEGFDGAPFLNSVVELDSEEDLDTLVRSLRRLEIHLGKDLTQPRFADKIIDIDVLYFGDHCIDNDRFTLPARDATYAYYLAGLYELAPDWVDVRSGKSVKDLWRSCDGPTSTVDLPVVALARNAKIQIDDLQLHLHLGVTEKERAEPQMVSLTISLHLSSPPAAVRSDEIADTLNYSTIARSLLSEFTNSTFHTIEHLASRCSGVIARLVNAEAALTVGVRKFPSTPGIEGGAYFELTTDLA